MKKRVLSALLVLCMACSMVSTVWATEINATSGAPEPASQTLNLDNGQPGDESGADSTGAPGDSTDSTSASSDNTSSGSSSAASDATSGAVSDATSGEGDEGAASSDSTAASDSTSSSSSASSDSSDGDADEQDAASSDVTGDESGTGAEEENDPVAEQPGASSESVPSQPNRAPAAAAPALLAGATVTVDDQIKSTGRLVATVSGSDEQLTYTWYRKADNGEFQEVTPVKVSGDDYNTEGNWLNVALDIESLCEGKTTAEKNAIRSQTYSYYVVVKQGETEVVRSDAYQVPYYAQLLNGDFEAGDAHWATTASTDTTIEIGSYSQDMHVYGTTNDRPVTGGDTNFAELNAHEAASLYQDVLTVPGTELTWQLAHRARNANALDWERDNFIEDATDTMYVVIMSESDAEALLADAAAHGMTQQQLLTDMIKHAFNTGSVNPDDGNMKNAQYELSDGKTVAVAVKEVTTRSCITLGDPEYVGFWPIGRYEYRNASSSGQWGVYGDSYKVPEGQYATRFFFVAGDTATDNATVGNLIDDVWFSPELPPPNPDQVTITGTKTVTIDELPSDYSVTINLSGPNDYTDNRTIRLTENGNGTYSGTYAFTNISIAANSTPTFTVTEAVTGEPSTELYEISNGGTVTSTNGTTETFTGLEAEVEVSRGYTYTVDFNNTYIPKTTDLTITKTFVGLDEAKANQVWDELGFTVASNGSTLAPTIDKADEVTANGDTFTAIATIKGLTIGQAYTITENGAMVDSYTLKTTATGVEGEQEVTEGTPPHASIDALTAGATVDFTNTYTRQTGTLVLNKDIAGLPTLPEDDQEKVNALIYNFIITGPADAVGVVAVDNDGDDNDIVFVANGDGGATATVPVAVGTNVRIENLPTGPYTVTEVRPSAETPNSNYEILDGKYYFDETVADNGNSWSGNLTKTGATATITNTYAPYYTVTVTKQVGGAMGSSEETFTFTSEQINSSNANNITIADGSKASLTESGFTMKAGGSLTVNKVKKSTCFSIVEVKAEGYVTTVMIDGADNTAGTDAPTTAYFTVGEEEVTVTYQNDRAPVAPTGLESNHTTPYVLMITAAGMAGLALIGGMAARRIRRRRQE